MVCDRTPAAAANASQSTARGAMQRRSSTVGCVICYCIPLSPCSPTVGACVRPDRVPRVVPSFSAPRLCGSPALDRLISASSHRSSPSATALVWPSSRSSRLGNSSRLSKRRSSRSNSSNSSNHPRCPIRPLHCLRRCSNSWHSSNSSQRSETRIHRPRARKRPACSSEEGGGRAAGCQGRGAARRMDAFR